MKIELDEDESWQVMSLVVARLLDEAKLPDADRAKIRRWKSDAMRTGGEPVRALVRKINEDLAAAWARKKRSPIVKPDWR